MLLEGFNKFIDGHPVLFGTVTFLLGFYIRHVSSSIRDRRTEFNKARTPIRDFFLSESVKPDIYRKEPSLSQIDEFVSCLHFWKRAGFRRAWEQYEQERAKGTTTYNESGEQFLLDAALPTIKHAASVCLRYTNRR